jgi:protein SCO1/2
MTALPMAAGTAEDALAEWVRSEACGEELVALLAEAHPLYAGRSTNETVRMRGWMLAQFERIGLPENALPFVLEELESGRDAFLVAGAAKAMRGGGVEAMRACAPFLRKALRNMRFLDSSVTFETYKPRWPLPRATTATKELRATLAWLGQAEEGEDCCEVALPSAPGASIGDVSRIELEDQDGQRVAFADFFHGKPVVLAFFYTRCDNPNKCSLTVARLARLQEQLAGRAKIAAITYDPLYDQPQRLRAFGETRGMQFGEDVRFFRAVRGFGELRAHFQLGVNFIGSIVNRHRIELSVLDARGRTAASFARLQWEPEAVVRAVDRALAPRMLRSVVAPLLLALLPKCPLCLTAYLGALGVGAMQVMPYARGLLFAFVAVHWLAVLRRRRWLALALSTAGAAALFSPLPLAGAGLMALGSVLTALPRKTRIP